MHVQVLGFTPFTEKDKEGNQVEKDEVDRDDLVDASVNAIEGDRNRQDAATGMNQANFVGGFATATVENIRAKAAE